MKRIPTVKFDTSRLTATVLADLERNIRKLPEINEQNFDEFYDLALHSLAVGGDLYMFSTGIVAMNIAGMTGKRAAQISTRIWSKAHGKMELERQAKLGITHARWMYSNAPCMVDPKAPNHDDLRRDAAHKAANEKIYVLNEGLVINGSHTWPGDEPGCRCMSRPIIPGVEEDEDSDEQPSIVMLQAALNNAIKFKGNARSAEMLMVLRELRDSRLTWCGSQENALKRSIDKYLRDEG